MERPDSDTNVLAAIFAPESQKREAHNKIWLRLCTLHYIAVRDLASLLAMSAIKFCYCLNAFKRYADEKITRSLRIGIFRNGT